MRDFFRASKLFKGTYTKSARLQPHFHYAMLGRSYPFSKVSLTFQSVLKYTSIAISSDILNEAC